MEPPCGVSFAYLFLHAERLLYVRRAHAQLPAVSCFHFVKAGMRILTHTLYTVRPAKRCVGEL